MLPSPFAWMSFAVRRRAFSLLLRLTLIVMCALYFIGAALKREPDAPHGILSFEFAGTFAQAQRILSAWASPDAHFAAGLSLGLDYLFMPLYALTIALCCVHASSGGPRWLATSGRALAWAQLLAALLDAVENYALIQLLLGAAGETWPRLAWGCAAVKFALVILGITFVFCCALPLRWWRRWQGQPFAIV